MERTGLGRTGLVVSRIGLGLAALGRPGYINLGHGTDLAAGREVASMEAHAHSVLDTAYAAGVRYFDAARSYGRAEAFLATWLESRGIRAGEVAVGSKWGYRYTAGWKVDAERHEVKDLSVENLRLQAAETRDLLGGYLGLYQIHSATLESGVFDDQSVLDELVRLKHSGWKLGLSVTGPRQGETIRMVINIFVNSEHLFDCVQATWNLLERSAEPALVEAHSWGLGVIVKEALANGRLTMRNNEPSFGHSRHLIEVQAKRLGTSSDALALAAVLAKPWADVVLSGAATEEQIRSNLGALQVGWDSEAETALMPLNEGANAYWTKRSSLQWN
jgi:aryl-alcohol dehydrogenase-like predicted oxidoreductase